MKLDNLTRKRHVGHDYFFPFLCTCNTRKDQIAHEKSGGCQEGYDSNRHTVMTRIHILKQ